MKSSILRSALCAVAVVITPLPAFADDSEEPDDATKAEATERDAQVETSQDIDFGHGGQFSLRAGLVAGYRVVFRYDQSHYCRDPLDDEDDPQQLCGFTAPLAMDLALGFAPLDFVEPFLWARLGLGAEDATDTEPLKVVGAGLRFYSRSGEALKILIEPAVGFELESGQGTPRYQQNEPSYNTDFVFHVAAGPQYDITENVGLYLGAGLTAGVIRAIHTNMEVQFGAQGRY